MQKVLIAVGVIFLVIGLAWPWLSSLPLGRLPGDLAIERENFKFYFPFTTMLLVSAIVSLIVWFFRQ